LAGADPRNDCIRSDHVEHIQAFYGRHREGIEGFLIFVPHYLRPYGTSGNGISKSEVLDGLSTEAATDGQ
jgi:hypothetical protein